MCVCMSVCVYDCVCVPELCAILFMFPTGSESVCVCVCARVRVCVRVCACAERETSTDLESVFDTCSKSMSGYYKLLHWNAFDIFA